MEEENALPLGWENMPYEEILVERSVRDQLKQPFWGHLKSPILGHVGFSISLVS